MRRWAKRIIIASLVMAGGLYAAFELSPWPSVLVLRYVFGEDATKRNAALERQRPDGISEKRNIRYAAHPSALFDLYNPAGGGDPRRPTIVWVHGGAFVAGDRSDLSGYLRVLAGRGYRSIAVGYPLAPASRYPAPVLAANEALAFLRDRGAEYGVDPANLILIGDSAGAQISAQLAQALTNPSAAQAIGLSPALPASSIKGIVLFCGIFDARQLRLEGAFGGFVRTILRAYFGEEDPNAIPQIGQFSVASNITPGFPASFISVGNADPLAPQSKALATAIAAAGSSVDTLFFPDDDPARLGHEYQFNLDTQAGKLALEKLLAFLESRK